jgi:hypothetical protein
MQGFIFKAFAVVRGKRFELSHPFGRYHLKVVRLPVSPSPLRSSTIPKESILRNAALPFNFNGLLSIIFQYIFRTEKNAEETAENTFINW